MYRSTSLYLHVIRKHTLRFPLSGENLQRGIHTCGGDRADQHTRDVRHFLQQIRIAEMENRGDSALYLHGLHQGEDAGGKAFPAHVARALEERD